MYTYIGRGFLFDCEFLLVEGLAEVFQEALFCFGYALVGDVEEAGDLLLRDFVEID